MLSTSGVTPAVAEPPEPPDPPPLSFVSVPPPPLSTLLTLALSPTRRSADSLLSSTFSPYYLSPLLIFRRPLPRSPMPLQSLLSAAPDVSDFPRQPYLAGTGLEADTSISSDGFFSPLQCSGSYFVGLTIIKGEIISRRFSSLSSIAVDELLLCPWTFASALPPPYPLHLYLPPPAQTSPSPLKPYPTYLSVASLVWCRSALKPPDLVLTGRFPWLLCKLASLPPKPPDPPDPSDARAPPPLLRFMSSLSIKAVCSYLRPVRLRRPGRLRLVVPLLPSPAPPSLAISFRLSSPAIGTIFMTPLIYPDLIGPKLGIITHMIRPCLLPLYEVYCTAACSPHLLFDSAHETSRLISSSLWHFEELVYDISISPIVGVLSDQLYPLFSFMEIVGLLISHVICGFDVGSILLKISVTSVSAQSKDSVNWFSSPMLLFVVLAIVNCAFDAVSIADLSTLHVFPNFQGCLVSSTAIGVKNRGLLLICGCSSYLLASYLLLSLNLAFVLVGRFGLLLCVVNI